MCYRCGRLGHREPQCPEAMAELTNLPSQEPEQRNPVASLLNPNHVSSPWKTVHTRRTRARGRPNESPQREKPEHVESYPPSHPRGPPRTPHDHANQYQHLESVTRQGCETEFGTAGLHNGEVATHDETTSTRPPRETRKESMQTPCKDGWPSLHTKLSDVPLVGLHAPCMAKCQQLETLLSHEHDMQRDMKANDPHSEPTPSTQTS